MPAPRSPLRTKLSFLRAEEIADFRQRLEVPQKIRLTQSSFAFGLKSEASELQIAVPLRSLESGDARQSEFGGLNALALYSTPIGLRFGLGYSEIRSSELELVSPHGEALVQLDLELKGTMLPGVNGSLHLGPRYAYSLKRQNSLLEYGPRAALVLDSSILVETGIGAIEVGGQLELQRRLGTSLVGIDQGQSGLLGYTAEIEWQLMDALWIGFVFQDSVERPVGREDLLGRTDLPGLYGKSYGATMRAMAF
jgi:hypothetical protein